MENNGLLSKTIIIYSQRKYKNRYFWDLVFEWENEMLISLEGGKMKLGCRLFGFANKLIRKYSWPCIGRSFIERRDAALHLMFDMKAKTVSDFHNRKNVIPIIIDFFLPVSKYKAFERAYNRTPMVLISSREVYESLLKENLNLKLAHWGLSLPDKYMLNPDKPFEKKFHFALVGRVNPILKAYLEKYVEKHPKVVYVIQGRKKYHYYTNNGEYVGYFRSRMDYINLIRMVKIALYSTPGMDGSRADTHGFNQVTPRFLECISAGCQMLMRYPDNPDTRFYELNSFCPSIETYEQFEQVSDRYLATDPDLHIYANYLQKHYTSTRVKELKKIIG